MNKIFLLLIAVYGSHLWVVDHPGWISRLSGHQFTASFPELTGKPLTRVEVQEKIERVPVTPLELDEAIGEAAQRREVPAELLRAIAKVESNIDEGNTAVRSETHLEAKHGEMDSKSYGIMQIMGFNAKSMCNVESWADLVGRKNLDTNVDCGARILKKCLERSTASGKATRYRQALGCYNGDKSGQYAQRVLLAYSELALG